MCNQFNAHGPLTATEQRRRRTRKKTKINTTKNVKLYYSFSLTCMYFFYLDAAFIYNLIDMEFLESRPWYVSPSRDIAICSTRAQTNNQRTVFDGGYAW